MAGMESVQGKQRLVFSRRKKAREEKREPKRQQTPTSTTESVKERKKKKGKKSKTANGPSTAVWRMYAYISYRCLDSVIDYCVRQLSQMMTGTGGDGDETTDDNDNHNEEERNVYVNSKTKQIEISNQPSAIQKAHILQSIQTQTKHN